MAEWDAAYISDLPDSAFACIDRGGEKEDDRTVPRSLRHYPHHNASGALDLPHLRNALSRVAQEDTTSCGVAHLRAHAEEESVGEARKSLAVKFADGSDDVIEGLAIPFGGPVRGGKDLQGESFGPDTDYAFDWFPEGRPITYDHAMSGPLKTSVQGRQFEHEIIDEGVFARAQLNRAAKYHATVSRLVRAGKLSFSSGSVDHLVEVDRGGRIKRWPWVELALTPEPAHPWAVAYAVKSTDLVERLEAADIALPAGLVAAALKALDSEADDIETDDDALLAGVKFADHADRLLVDAEAFRDRTSALVAVRAKSGRVLSRTTRDRLSRHPASLRELADDLDELLTEADSEKAAKAVLSDLQFETERQLSRLLGVTP